MRAENVSQNQNKKTSYDELVKTIKSEHKNLAKELIPQLCYALANEDPMLSEEDIRARIKKDLIDIWSISTIYDNIPDEFKDKQKQEAGKKRKKNVRESSATTSEQKVIEQSITSNGCTATIDPNPLKGSQAQYEQQELKPNPSIDTDLMTLNHQEEKQNLLQSVVEKLQEEKQNLQSLFDKSEKEKQELKEQLRQPKQQLTNSKVKIPANEIVKLLINRAIKMRQSFVELPIDENGIGQLPRVKTI